MKAAEAREGMPLISVISPTYNHVAFIAKCMDGVLAQKGNFEIEHLIGEDASADGTREVCQQYANLYPMSIRLFLRERKDVMYIMGRATGRANLLQLLNEARGEYIALCEGDDYWVDPTKLQKQLTALYSAPDAVACFTDAYNEKEGVRTPYMDGVYAHPPTGPVRMEDLVPGRRIPTSTFLFRRDALFPLPQAMYVSPVGDTTIFFKLAQQGHFIYLPDRTSVRSLHAGGIYSAASHLHRTRVELRTIEVLDEMSEGRFKEGFLKRRLYILHRNWVAALRDNDAKLAQLIWKEAARHPQLMGWNRTTTWRHWAKAYWPLVDRIYGKLFEPKVKR